MRFSHYSNVNATLWHAAQSSDRKREKARVRERARGAKQAFLLPTLKQSWWSILKWVLQWVNVKVRPVFLMCFSCYAPPRINHRCVSPVSACLSPRRAEVFGRHAQHTIAIGFGVCATLEKQGGGGVERWINTDQWVRRISTVWSVWNFWGKKRLFLTRECLHITTLACKKSSVQWPSCFFMITAVGLLLLFLGHCH